MDVKSFVQRAKLSGEGPVAVQVQQVMLAAIAQGELVAGDVIHDHEWASAFGVSRTPVREAIQHLHSMGLLTVAAARYTRLQTYTPEEAQQEARDWSLLHNALTSSVMDRLPDELIDRLCRVRDVMVGQTHPDHIQTGNFTFFRNLRQAAPHSTVTLGATAAAYRLRLAEAALPLTPHAHTTLHDGIIHALKTRSPRHAREALANWMPGL
ncbi:GntR family transcriptional regulator [Microbacterium rhizomatis]|uniref:GntR family transcriptional regulator n=1 Tax=Microbacterium rhizomatis TaxID=1631477 RepID=A0A5J5J447_9MICO|nr:GntR family transcriptional regulator [Microbacterium rhizomatis]KAA9108250.1 GntR family transcriptional regulator [Microbacterium rhizomatis]